MYYTKIKSFMIKKHFNQHTLICCEKYINSHIVWLYKYILFYQMQKTFHEKFVNKVYTSELIYTVPKKWIFYSNYFYLISLSYHNYYICIY